MNGFTYCGLLDCTATIPCWMCLDRLDHLQELQAEALRPVPSRSAPPPEIPAMDALTLRRVCREAAEPLDAKANTA